MRKIKMICQKPLPRIAVGASFWATPADAKVLGMLGSARAEDEDGDQQQAGAGGAQQLDRGAPRRYNRRDMKAK
ncbi:hypothetical protein ABWU93_11375 [Xanthomonas translucens pv. translucens]|uniref:hypothetical protein n=1 Tax=Xanthomonas campestris pv. translucens TaxID=343 RepID=UPI003F7019BE